MVFVCSKFKQILKLMDKRDTTLKSKFYAQIFWSSGSMDDMDYLSLPYKLVSGPPEFQLDPRFSHIAVLNQPSCCADPANRMRATP